MGLTFLERLGGYIAEAAECSSRSSSHCNILDALQGVESISGNIISAGISFGDSNSCKISGGGASNNLNDNSNQTSWEALAAFGYGASWRQQQQQTTMSNNNNKNSTEDEKNK